MLEINTVELHLSGRW